MRYDLTMRLLPGGGQAGEEEGAEDAGAGGHEDGLRVPARLVEEVACQVGARERSQAVRHEHPAEVLAELRRPHHLARELHVRHHDAPVPEAQDDDGHHHRDGVCGEEDAGHQHRRSRCQRANQQHRLGPNNVARGARDDAPPPVAQRAVLHRCGGLRGATSEAGDDASGMGDGHEATHAAGAESGEEGEDGGGLDGLLVVGELGRGWNLHLAELVARPHHGGERQHDLTHGHESGVGAMGQHAGANEGGHEHRGGGEGGHNQPCDETLLGLGHVGDTDGDSVPDAHGRAEDEAEADHQCCERRDETSDEESGSSHRHRQRSHVVRWILRVPAGAEEHDGSKHRQCNGEHKAKGATRDPQRALECREKDGPRVGCSHGGIDDHGRDDRRRQHRAFRENPSRRQLGTLLGSSSRHSHHLAEVLLALLRPGGDDMPVEPDRQAGDRRAVAASQRGDMTRAQSWLPLLQ
mmetsp:Transcript_6352/g.12896  ORF Transcript_6352/g.12896 Transcript_6352/m.12896 type:complete len:466 (-) Transcript_6352:99-1496(-)